MLQKHIDRYRLKWKQRRCKHEYKSLNDEVEIGITMSWGGKPTKHFQSTYQCTKCGRSEPQTYIYFGGLYDDKEETK